jgi:NADH dehydrogenase
MAAAGDLLPVAPLTSDQLAMLARDNVMSPDALGLEAFDITPTPMEAIAPAYLERYRRFGRFARPARPA